MKILPPGSQHIEGQHARFLARNVAHLLRRDSLR